MADETITDAALLSRVKADLKRLALLGLLPEDGAKISERGEFIVDPSNVENDENKKMRSYRYIEFPKTLHAWPDGDPSPVTLSVRNRDEEQKAVALGWSVDPLHGPGGRLENGVAKVADEVTEVREFAPPGQKQPFESDEDEPEKPKRGRTAKK